MPQDGGNPQSCHWRAIQQVIPVTGSRDEQTAGAGVVCVERTLLSAAADSCPEKTKYSRSNRTGPQCVRTSFRTVRWNKKAHAPRSGGTGKPGTAVPGKRNWTQQSPARDGTQAMTQIPEGRLKFSRTLERPGQFSSCCMGKPGTGRARLHRLRKYSCRDGACPVSDC